MGFPRLKYWSGLPVPSPGDHPDSWIVLGSPALQETQVWSLGLEDLLEKGLATHSSILAWRIHMERGAWGATVPGVTKSRAWLNDSAHTHTCFILSRMLLQDREPSKLTAVFCGAQDRVLSSVLTKESLSQWSTSISRWDARISLPSALEKSSFLVCKMKALTNYL